MHHHSPHNNNHHSNQNYQCSNAGSTTNTINNDTSLVAVDASNQPTQVPPDSPSLVKVKSWYTVAKQGVSC